MAPPSRTPSVSRAETGSSPAQPSSQPARSSSRASRLRRRPSPAVSSPESQESQLSNSPSPVDASRASLRSRVQRRQAVGFVGGLRRRVRSPTPGPRGRRNLGRPRGQIAAPGRRIRRRGLRANQAQPARTRGRMTSPVARARGRPRARRSRGTQTEETNGSTNNQIRGRQLLARAVHRYPRFGRQRVNNPRAVLQPRRVVRRRQEAVRQPRRVPRQQPRARRPRQSLVEPRQTVRQQRYQSGRRLAGPLRAAPVTRRPITSQPRSLVAGGQPSSLTEPRYPLGIAQLMQHPAFQSFLAHQQQAAAEPATPVVRPSYNSEPPEY